MTTLQRILELSGIIKESPLSDLELHGDFDVNKNTTLTTADKKLVTTDKYKTRIFKAFQKTPYNFKIVIIDGNFNKIHVKNNDIFDYEGVFSTTQFGIKPDPNLITAIIIHNQSFGDNHMPLTPWIIAHKIGHALFSDSFIFRMNIQDLINTASKTKKGHKLNFLKFKVAKYQDPDFMEVCIDLISQYLIQGKVTFDYTGYNNDTFSIRKLSNIQNTINELITEKFNSLNGTILVGI